MSTEITSGASPTVLTLITAGLTEVKDAVNALSRDLHGTMARLPTEYVPRRELERRLDEMVIDLGAEIASRRAEVKALSEAAKALQDERRVHFRWLVGLAAGTLMSGTGVILGIITNFSS